MAKLDADSCDLLAHLARLSLTPAEREVFAGQLTDILAYMSKLKAVDITDVPEFRSPAPPTPPRADKPGPMLERARALAGAAHVREGQVAVPKILEDA